MFNEWRGDQNVKVSLKEKLIEKFKNQNATTKIKIAIFYYS